MGVIMTAKQRNTKADLRQLFFVFGWSAAIPANAKMIAGANSNRMK
jgi:hypothetical protein